MPDHAQDLAYRLEVLRGAHRLKSCYLAGPMTGLPEFNMHAFNLCEGYLKAAGFEVHNPVAVDAEHGIVLTGKNGHEEFDFLAAMKRDLPLVMDADCVIVMPGWEESKGAQLEVHTALATGVPVFTILSQREIKTGCAPEASAPSRTRAGTGGEENRVSSSPTQIDPDTGREISGWGIDYDRSHPPIQEGVLPTDSAARKELPVTSGFLDYFPAAVAAVATVSKEGNDKHNPGEPLHHARGKSMDHADCIGRHLLERGSIDPQTGQRHSAQLAWRAMALLQEELEADGAPMARGAREPE